EHPDRPEYGEEGTDQPNDLSSLRGILPSHDFDRPLRTGASNKCDPNPGSRGRERHSGPDLNHRKGQHDSAHLAGTTSLGPRMVGIARRARSSITIQEPPRGGSGNG